MVTAVGMQSNFLSALKDLVELDYDAIEAYQAAINRLESKEYRGKMQEFMDDHKEHVEKLNEVLVQHGENAVLGASGKQWLTKGKVVLANLMGDDGTILKAMLSNEEDTNTAYDRISKHSGKFKDCEKIINKGLEDEKRHKKWLEDTIKNL